MNELHDLAHLNVWVYNYLLEQGLRHSAFVFRTETQLKDCDISPAPTGFLTNLVEKGLLYTELETEIVQEVCAPLALANGEAILVDEERIQTYIDRRINERLADCAIGKDLVLEKAESKPANEMQVRDIYKIFVHDQRALVWNQTNDKVHLIDLRSTENNLSKAWALFLAPVIPSFKINFHENALFYNDSTLLFVDYENNFKVTNMFAFTQAGTTIKSVDRTDHFTIISTSNESEKYFFDAKGSYVTTLEGNARYLELADSFIVCNFSSNEVERRWLQKDVFSMRYTTANQDLTLVEACLNQDSTILTVYFVNKETQKGEVYVWLVDKSDYVYSLETKSIFKEIKFNSEKMLLLVGPQIIKVLDVFKGEFLYSEQFESIIRAAEFIGSEKLIIELIGNRIKKIDLGNRICTEIDKSGYGSHMYICPAVAKILEFENLESFRFIDL